MVQGLMGTGTIRYKNGYTLVTTKTEDPTGTDGYYTLLEWVYLGTKTEYPTGTDGYYAI